MKFLNLQLQNQDFNENLEIVKYKNLMSCLLPPFSYPMFSSSTPFLQVQLLYPILCSALLLLSQVQLFCSYPRFSSSTLSQVQLLYSYPRFSSSTLSQVQLLYSYPGLSSLTSILCSAPLLLSQVQLLYPVLGSAPLPYPRFNSSTPILGSAPLLLSCVQLFYSYPRFSSSTLSQVQLL